MNFNSQHTINKSETLWHHNNSNDWITDSLLKRTNRTKPVLIGSNGSIFIWQRLCFRFLRCYLTLCVINRANYVWSGLRRSWPCSIIIMRRQRDSNPPQRIRLYSTPDVLRAKNCMTLSLSAEGRTWAFALQEWWLLCFDLWGAHVWRFGRREVVSFSVEKQHCSSSIHACPVDSVSAHSFSEKSKIIISITKPHRRPVIVDTSGH